MVPLSPATVDRIRALFAEHEVAQAERMLSEGCAESLPLWSDSSPSGLERVRFAAIRLSGGDLSRLTEGIRLAHVDWRDLLVSAGFAEDVGAHKSWTPRRFEPGVVARWLRGERIEGVAFAAGSVVQVSCGPYRSNSAFPGPAGKIVELTGLEPEPRFTVQLNDGGSVEVFQFAIRHAG